MNGLIFLALVFPKAVRQVVVLFAGAVLAVFAITVVQVVLAAIFGY